MAVDITMCPGGACPLRDGCFRYRAQPDARQDWFGRAPYDDAAKGCEQFWSLEAMAPDEATIRTRAYFLWERDGRPEGRADAHWRAARAELEDALAARLRP